MIMFLAWLRRALERFASRLPYWPDPAARCPAHGRLRCGPCHRNPGNCGDVNAASVRGRKIV